MAYPVQLVLPILAETIIIYNMPKRVTENNFAKNSKFMKIRKKKLKISKLKKMKNPKLKNYKVNKDHSRTCDQCLLCTVCNHGSLDRTSPLWSGPSQPDL